jgi:hypothetical protein
VTEEQDAQARIDQLAYVAKNDASQEHLTALWSATFELERWWFVQRGEPDNPHPFVGVFDGQPFVLGFTSAKRARNFAVSNGYASADGSAFVLAMTPDDAVDVAASWANEGIHAITFDHGITGYFAPLANLPAIRSHVRGEANDNDLAPDPDPVV